MKHLSIQKPCSENWNQMTPTEKGAFCQKCCKQVTDFSNQSSEEIRKTLLLNKGKELCGRITEGQLSNLNDDYTAWRRSNTWSMQRVSFYSFLFVFGLTMVSCARQEDEQKIKSIQETAMQVIEADKPHLLEGKAYPEELETPILPEIGCEYPLDIEIEEVIVDGYIENKHDITTLGMMVPSRHYLDYLEDVTPNEPTKEQYDAQGRLIPIEFSALAFPNPTNGRTTLKFEVAETTNARFEMFSIDGRRIDSIDPKEFQPGTYEIPFDLSNELPGTYIIAILSEGFKESVKVIKI